MNTEQLEALKKQIEAMTPPDRLRLAAELLEAKRPQLAHTIANKVVIELGAALALAKIGVEPKKGEAKK